jgi:hypothetical protein
MSECLGGCPEAARDLGLEDVWCCGSCHDDDEGCYLTEIETDRGWYSVCCAKYTEWKLLNKEI